MDDQLSSYIFLRNNVYYFSRRVPLDMKDDSGSKRIVKSLRTRSKRVAVRGSNQINFQLETYWSSIRVGRITRGLVSSPINRVNTVASGCGYDLLDVKDHYLKLKGPNKSQKFEGMVNRNIRYLIDAIGNKDISSYTSSDGSKFREYLLTKGLALSSTKRAFASLRPMINLMIQEHGLDIKNPPMNTYMPDDLSTSKR